MQLVAVAVTTLLARRMGPQTLVTVELVAVEQPQLVELVALV
jgi:hypothetical protein